MGLKERANKQKQTFGSVGPAVPSSDKINCLDIISSHSPQLFLKFSITTQGTNGELRRFERQVQLPE